MTTEIPSVGSAPTSGNNANKHVPNNNHNDEVDASTNKIGSGPLFRRTVIRRRVIRGNTNSKKKKNKAVCFNWLSLITCLITMEAICLVFLVFRSQTILIDPTLEEDTLHLLVWLDTKLGGGGDHDREELEQLESWLVQRTEDRLDHGHLLEHESETVALDDYYQRKHIDLERKEDEGTKINNNNKPAVLLVAGVQGSGSRAVVDALFQINHNFNIISLDHPPNPDTLSETDKKSLHMGQIAWREMINIVLQSGIKTTDYEFGSLPKFSQLRIQKEWEKFYQGYIAKQLPEITGIINHNNNNNKKNNNGGGILYGLQAHDALFLLPVFQEFMVGPLKVIHVLRDGRDVSILNSKPKIGSDKKKHPMHSMAERFVLQTHYQVSNLTKSNTHVSTTNLTLEEQNIVRSMELWNDWNRDSLTWLEQHSNTHANKYNNNNHPLDYLQLRTEDLLSPEKKLEALLQLSHFTGISKSVPFEKLCCLSRQAMVIEKSDGYLKSFAKARAQHDILNKYSAHLSFLVRGDEQIDQEEEERRKERLGDLMMTTKRRRNPGPLNGHRNIDPDDVHQEVHHHRKNRFQDIGDRLAARQPANPAEGRRRRRRLLEAEAEEEDQEQEEKETNGLLLMDKPLDVQKKMNETEGGGGGNSSTTGGQGRINSPEVKAMFKEYYNWRKTLGQSRRDPEAAAAAIERGEQLLVAFHKHEEHFKGVLTEDSFTRSIQWLKKLHTSSSNSTNTRAGNNNEEEDEPPPPPPPNHISHRYGKWAQVLREQPELAHRLNTVGNLTLQLFGYEPYTRFMDFEPQNKKAMCVVEMICN